MSNNQLRWTAYDYLVAFVVIAVTIPSVISAIHGHVGVLDVAAFCATALLITYHAYRLIRWEKDRP